MASASLEFGNFLVSQLFFAWKHPLNKGFLLIWAFFLRVMKGFLGHRNSDGFFSHLLLKALELGFLPIVL
jgi:hypothetical protein